MGCGHNTVRWSEASGAGRGLLDALAIPGLTLDHIREVMQQLAFEAHAQHANEEGVANIHEGELIAKLRPLLGGTPARRNLPWTTSRNAPGCCYTQVHKLRYIANCKRPVNTHRERLLCSFIYAHVYRPGTAGARAAIHFPPPPKPRTCHQATLNRPQSQSRHNLFHLDADPRHEVTQARRLSGVLSCRTPRTLSHASTRAW